MFYSLKLPLVNMPGIKKLTIPIAINILTSLERVIYEQTHLHTRARERACNESVDCINSLSAYKWSRTTGITVLGLLN